MINASLTIQLIGERVRTIVRDVISPSKVIAEITSMPMTKGHDYKQGDFVECHVEIQSLGRFWVGKRKVYLIEEPIEEVKDVRVRAAKSSK